MEAMRAQFGFLVIVTSWLRNHDPTIGFNIIFDFDSFQHVFLSSPAFPQRSQRGFHFSDPKSTQIRNNQTLLIFEISILALEVSQKSVLAFPCRMGSVFLLPPHAARECPNWLLRHLPRENYIFHFSTPPLREAQKSWNAFFESVCRRHVFKTLQFPNEFS